MGEGEGPFEPNGVELHAHSCGEPSRGNEYVTGATPQVEQGEGLAARFRLAQQRTKFGEHREGTTEPPIGGGDVL
jgi:hypothetical protein